MPRTLIIWSRLSSISLRISTMNSHDSQPCAAVLSGNIGSKKSLNNIDLALTRSLGRQGVQAIRFYPDRSLVDLTSRYCTQIACPNPYDRRVGMAANLPRPHRRS